MRRLYQKLYLVFLASLLSVLAMWFLFVNAGRTYEHFPSLTPPLFAPTWAPPTWLMAVAWIAGLVLSGSMGLITAALIRTKAITLLRQNPNASPRIAETLESAAQHDAALQVRRAAREAPAPGH